MTAPLGNRVANVDLAGIYSKWRMQKNFAFISLPKVLLRSQGLICVQPLETKA